MHKSGTKITVLLLQAFLDTELSLLCMTCPYHRWRASLIIFSIGATLSHFRTSSFVTQSGRVKPRHPPEHLHLHGGSARVSWWLASIPLHIGPPAIGLSCRCSTRQSYGPRCSGILLLHRMPVDLRHLSHAVLTREHTSGRVSPSAETRDLRYLNWAVFFNSWPSIWINPRI